MADDEDESGRRFAVIEELTRQINGCAPHTDKRRKLQKQKLNKEFELAEILELRRVREVQEEAIRTGFVLNLIQPSEISGEECPICMTPFEEPKSCNEAPGGAWYSCCGKFICISCVEQARKLLLNAKSDEEFGALQSSCNACPFCREPLPFDDTTETNKRVLALAERGNTYAQRRIAQELWTGIERDVKRAAYWYQQAADKGNLDAQAFLGRLHEFGYVEAGIEKSVSKAREYFSKCAYHGCARSQADLGRLLFDNDHLTAVRWLTLSAAQGDIVACRFLGFALYKEKCGTQLYLQRAHYWTKKAALFGLPNAQDDMVGILYDTTVKAYDEEYDIVGYSVIPQALYWARKSVATSARSTVLGFLQHFEQERDSACSCCEKLPSEDVCLSCCTRCRAVAYCSRECQQKHWTMGHKVDCFQLEEDEHETTG